MATITHFTPSPKTTLICQKGDLHQGQPLNMVCLDKLCRSGPLSCSICFAENHKYHKVVGLSKFIDDYARNTQRADQSTLQNKISRDYYRLKQKISEMKSNLVKQIETFENAIEKYAQHLIGSSVARRSVGEMLGVQLEPEKIRSLKSQIEVQKSLCFILNNCLYDQSLNMVNTSEILKQNSQRITALLDKMVYMTGFCSKSLEQSIDLLRFAKDTIKEEKLVLNHKIQKLMCSNSDPFSCSNFSHEKQEIKKIIEQAGSLLLQEASKVESNDSLQGRPLPLFGCYRGENVEIVHSGKGIKSNVNCQKPQYAMVWPNINLQPKSVQEWSFKVEKCRNFTSQNTMALGISKLSDMQLSNFKGNPLNCLMISSQGFVSVNGKVEKTKFTFQEGDVIHFRYDPFYRTVEVSKQNGRKLNLKAFDCDQPVFACVRLTYASDQISLI